MAIIVVEKERSVGCRCAEDPTVTSWPDKDRLQYGGV